MSPESPGEFRRYRRFLSWLILTFVTLGSVYLLVSVGVTIYRRRHAVPLGDTIGQVASTADVEGCAEELADVELGLERHLENFRGLIATYDPQDAQRWEEDRAFWLGQWKAAGQRCRYTDHRPGPHAKDWVELGVIHGDLRDIETTYNKELLRFVEAQAPRITLLHKRLETVRGRIGAGGPAPTATPASAGGNNP
jgi:hypothetical protein